MVLPSDEEIRQFIENLQQNWFTQSVDQLKIFEQSAQGMPHLTVLHEYLSRYYHLAGDYQKATFYAIHALPMMDLTEQSLHTEAVVNTVLDYFIYKSNGQLNGATILQQITPSENKLGLGTATNGSFNTKTENIYQNTAKNQTQTEREKMLQKPFYLLDSIQNDIIMSVIEKVIGKSSPESILSFKIHVMNLNEEDLRKASKEQLAIILGDLLHHQDFEYKQKMLKEVSKIYEQSNDILNALKCLIHMRDANQISKFIIRLVESDKINEAIQSSFDIYETIPQQIIDTVAYNIRKCAASSAVKQTLLIIADEILSGKIFTTLYIDFMQGNQRLDRNVIRKFYSNQSYSTEQLSAYFLMHSLMTLSTLSYEHRKGQIDKQVQYQIFSHYANIGLIYRGHNQLPKEISDLLENIAGKDPYQVGGGVLALAFQHAGLNSAELSKQLTYLLEIDSTISSIENKGPIIHGLALAAGLVTMGKWGDENIEMVITHILKDGTESQSQLDLKNDVDVNYAVLLSIGMTMLGYIEFRDSEFFLVVQEKLGSENEKIRRAAAICCALMCYRRNAEAEPIIEMLSNYSVNNPGQFAASVDSFASLAIGLAYIQSGSASIAQRLLLLAQKFTRSAGARMCIQAIGLVLYKQKFNKDYADTIFPLIKMCTRSFDNEIRAGACNALGYLFATTGYQKAVDTCVKMMSDQEEVVRSSAIIAQSMILQGINGVDLPEPMKIEMEEPVGDRQKNCIYRSDYLNDNDKFDRIKNQQKLYKPCSLNERYKDLYVTKNQRSLTINEYVTQFRYDLGYQKPNERPEPFISRCIMVALGILNCGGLNVSFKQRTDVQCVSWVLFNESWNWYPLMGSIGLCMEADFISCVVYNQQEGIQKVEPLLMIPKVDSIKVAYSSFSKEVKTTDVGSYVLKARLSQQDITTIEGRQGISDSTGFHYIREIRDLALQEYSRQADNVRLGDALEKPLEKKSDQPEEPYEIYQAPTRMVEQAVDVTKLIENCEFEVVFDQLKRGVVVMKMTE